MALKFKAGYRRVNNSAHPSTYQMNYSWKDPAPGTEQAPLIEAAHQLSKPSKIVVSADHSRHPTCPVHRSASPAVARRRAQGAELNGKENVAPDGRKRPIVEPLAIPGSSDASGRENVIPSEPLRTRDTVGTRVRAGKTLESHVPTHKRKSASPAGRGGIKKRRKYSSPLKRLYESDYRRQGLAKALFQTQYQMQYKDWLREMEAGVGQQGRPRKDQREGGREGGLGQQGRPRKDNCESRCREAGVEWQGGLRKDQCESGWEVELLAGREAKATNVSLVLRERQSYYK